MKGEMVNKEFGQVKLIVLNCSLACKQISMATKEPGGSFLLLKTTILI